MIITKPVLCSTQMVQAILYAHKTMTRRLVKPQPTRDAKLTEFRYGVPCFSDGTSGNRPYNVDDILYVRETWANAYLNGGSEDFIDAFAYKADGKLMYYSLRGELVSSSRKVGDLHSNAISAWRPSIFMPKEAARIFLRVTDVRVERLQDIPRDDLAREGVITDTFAEFSVLWDSFRKSKADRAQYGWDANPWVWVISFERCEKP